MLVNCPKLAVGITFDSASSSIESLVFADNSVWDLSRIRQEVLKGTNGSDIIYGLSGGDFIAGGLSMDMLYGNAGDDTLVGGKGDDQLNGGYGDDIYQYTLGDGNDFVIEPGYVWGNTSTAFNGDSGGGRDTLQLKNIHQEDILARVDVKNNLTLTTVDGTTINVVGEFSVPFDSASSSIESLVFADNSVWDLSRIRQEVLKGTNGSDIIYGLSGGDFIAGGLSMDALYGNAGDDTLVGGKGNDQLNGGIGDDLYQYALGDGQDVIVESAGIDKVSLSSDFNESSIIVRRKADQLVLTLNSKEAIVVANMFNATTGALNSDGAIEAIAFSDGHIWDQSRILQEALKALPENQKVYAFNTDDLLTASAPVNEFFGMGGNDTYVFNRGEFQIAQIEDLSGSADEFRFGAGISISDLTIQKRIDRWVDNIPTVNNLTIGLNTGESILIKGGLLAGQSIEKFIFANGDVKTQAQFVAMATDVFDYTVNTVDGTDGNDLLPGLALRDLLHGGSGNDTISGGTGEDELYGDAGDDVIYGSSNHDEMYGGEGNDSLYGGEGDDYLSGGDGSDYLDGGLDVVVSYGNSLYGNDGDDVLINGSMMWGGSGSDTYIANHSAIHEYASDDGSDRIIVNAGTLPSQIIVKFYSGHGGNNFGDFLGFYSSEDGKYSEQNLLFEIATDANVLRDDRFSNWMTFQNVTTSAYGIESIKFDNGTVWSVLDIFNSQLKPTDQNDIIVGSSGDNTLRGSLGDDKLYGGGGNDQYVYNRGDGIDLIYESTGFDSIVLNDISESEVRVKREGDNLIVLANDNKIIEVRSAYKLLDFNLHPLTELQSIESIKFANGGVWDEARIKSEAVKSTSGNDTILGFTSGGDYIDGGEGDDQIYSNGGVDTLIGGAGNDLLVGESGGLFQGGVGDDVISAKGDATFKFSRGDGKDYVFFNAVEFDNKYGGNIIEFGQGIVSGDVTFSRNENDIVIAAGQGDQITIRNVFNYSSNKISLYNLVDTLKFSDGDVINIATQLTSLGYDVNQPSTLQNVLFDGNVVTGIAEPSSRVIVTGSLADYRWETIADAQTGAFSVTTPAFERVTVISQDDVGNYSQILQVDVTDILPPEIPDASISNDGLFISGGTELGIFVVIKNATTGSVLATVNSDPATGTYSFQLETPLLNKEKIEVVAKDRAGNVSPINTIYAPDKTPPEAPSATFNTAGKVITGSAEPGSTVEVRMNGSDSVLKSVKANATTGAYSITLTTALINNEIVNVTAKDATGNISLPKSAKAPDKTKPAAPTAKFDTTGKYITGNAEPGSTVVAKKSGSTASLGSVVADASGAYTITLATALKNKEVVNVTATDLSGNASTATSATAPLITAKTAVKTVKTSEPVSSTAQVDAMIQAMASFAPPAASESNVLVGFYRDTHPLLASQS